MKNFKRTLAMLLSAALLLCSVPMIAASAEAVSAIPEFHTEKRFVVDSIQGQINSVTVPAGADMYHDGGAAYRMAGWLPGGREIAGSTLANTDYLEMDVYVSSDLSADSIRMWISDNWDGALKRGYLQIPALKAGWNHIVKNVNEISGNDNFYFKSYNKWNSLFWEGVPSRTEDITIAFGNIALTADKYVYGAMNNTYPYSVFERNGKVCAWSKHAGEAMIWSDCFYINNGNNIDITNAKYIEMDIYAYQANEAGMGIWLSTAFGDDPARRFFNTGALISGLNHVVIDLTQYSNSYENQEHPWNNKAVKTIFLAPFTPSEDIAYDFGNIAFTTDVEPVKPEEPVEELGNDPEVVPEAKYSANVVETRNVDLKGEKNNFADERYYNWGTYKNAFSDMINNSLNITKGDYLEFYLYSDIDNKFMITLGSTQTDPDNPKGGYMFGFIDNRSNTKDIEVKAGWNHIIVSTDGAFREKDVTTLFTYNPESVNGIVLRGPASGYIRLTNIALTRETPMAKDTYVHPIIDFADSIIATKTWAGTQSGDIYNSNDYQDRLFVNLGKTIDITLAEFVEFDIWVSAPMRDLSIWVCNNYDGLGRNVYVAPFSNAKVGWNHYVIDLSTPGGDAGAIDKTNWTSVFFQGDPNDDGVEVTVKLANLGASKSYPDMNNTYTAVDNTLAGVQTVGTPTTVPAGEDLYSAYQMWKQDFTIDMTKAEYIELDIYASEATDNEIVIWTSVDTVNDRAKYRIPVLEKGWNHVVIDLKADLLVSNGDWNLESFTEWRGFFFQGVPSNSNTITFKIANIAATKFAPDPTNKFIEVTSHPEIYSKADYANAEVDTGTLAFKAAVDFKKADTLEFDLYADAEITNDITVTLTDENSVTGTITISAESITAGWNHIILSTSDIDLSQGINISSVAGIAFAGTLIDSSEDSLTFAVANIALTAEETLKQDMTYKGKVISRFNGYNQVSVPATEDIANVASPIVLPVDMDLTDIDYIEMNLYVSAKCDLIINLNATPIEEEDIYEEANAYYILEGLTYGWNQIHVPVAELDANNWFDPEAVTYIYFSGVPATSYDVIFTVEDLAVTSEALEFEIAQGDFNADGFVDIRDVIHVVKYNLAGEKTWFANAAEIEGTKNGIIDASDIVALRKLLFTSF